MRFRLHAVVLAASLPALLLGSALSSKPVRAGGTAPAKPASAPRGWRTFLGNRVVRRPTGIAVDLRGNPQTGQWGYVADAATGRIVKFGTGGRVLGSWLYSGPGHPAALAVGGSGNVFVGDEVTGRIRKFSPGGKPLGVWGVFAGLRGISLDPQGHIYVAEYGVHRVTELTSRGAVLERWDTAAGFPALFSVPHVSSGPLGDPTGVAFDPPNRIFVSTFCRADPSCRPRWETPRQPYAHDALAALQISGTYAGYVGNFWFGLGYGSDGAPIEAPYKEAEPIVTVDVMTGDGQGHAYLAGTFWALGGTLSRGVMAYTDTGYRHGPWALPSQSPVSGVAVDGRRAIYVSQADHVLKLAR